MKLLLVEGAPIDNSPDGGLLNRLNQAGLTRQQQRRMRQHLRKAGAREFPDWYLRWRWSLKYGWRWRLRRWLYEHGWRWSAMKNVIFALVVGTAVTTHAQYRIDVEAERERFRELFKIGSACAADGGGPREVLPLELRVVSFTPRDVPLGGKISFEVEIKNVGKQLVSIPWSVLDTAECFERDALSLALIAPSETAVCFRRRPLWGPE